MKHFTTNGIKTQTEIHIYQKVYLLAIKVTDTQIYFAHNEGHRYTALCICRHNSGVSQCLLMCKGKKRIFVVVVFKKIKGGGGGGNKQKRREGGGERK